MIISLTSTNITKLTKQFPYTMHNDLGAAVGHDLMQKLLKGSNIVMQFTHMGRESICSRTNSSLLPTTQLSKEYFY